MTTQRHRTMTEVDVTVLRALQLPQKWLTLPVKEDDAVCTPLCCVTPAPVRIWDVPSLKD